MKRPNLPTATRVGLALVLAGLAGGCDQSTDPVTAVTGSAQAGREIAGDMALKGVADCVKAFEIDMGRLPTDKEGLGVLLSSDAIDAAAGGANDWNGPYVSAASMLNDRYGTPIVYRRSGSGFELISYGADGEPGGTGSGSDITYSGGL